MGIKQEATRIHESGHNCAQSVFCACREYTGIDDKTALVDALISRITATENSLVIFWKI